MRKITRHHTRFAVCVTDKEPDLEPGKLYLVLPDERASQEGYLRVIDESGEDYLYPEDYFVFVQLPKKAKEVLLAQLQASDALKTAQKLFS
ncbi:MAG: hypothetical protein QXQ53_07980 [Candidatus Methanosuratincola sp.]